MPDSSEEEQRTVRRDAKIGWIVLIVLFLSLLIPLIWPWLYAQEGSGFGASTVSKDERYKTLWDWMELLLVPLVLAGGAFWLNQATRAREQKIADQRAESERDAAKKRADAERQIASEAAQETALQTYLNHMTELLLTHNLRASDSYDEVRIVARARTLTMLQVLDKERKRSVIWFLQEAELISGDNAIVSLSLADLNDAYLAFAHLPHVNLRGASLRRANLQGAHLVDASLRMAELIEATLSLANLERANLQKADLQDAKIASARLINADLSSANLIGANLWRSDLQNANLNDADLRKAELSQTDLRGASFIGADLSKANFNQAKVTIEQLSQAKALEGTILPDGTVHD